LYSPGSDFIAYGNTFITALVSKDLNDEDITQLLEFYNGSFLQLFEAYLRIYTDLYAVFGNQAVMPFKLIWDLAIYWGINALRFLQGKVTDPMFTQALGPQLGAVVQMTARMEEVFKEWHRLSSPEQHPGWVSPNGIPPLHSLQQNLGKTFGDDELQKMFVDNTEFLRGLAVLIFHQAVQALPDTTIDEDQPINPLAISLNPARWEEDGLFDESGMSLARAREVAAGVEEYWLDQAVASR
jgi:hypothetical protein